MNVDDKEAKLLVLALHGFEPASGHKNPFENEYCGRAGSKIQHQPHVTGSSHRLKVVQISFFSRLLTHPQPQEASHSHSHIHVDVIKIISNMLLFMLARVCQILKWMTHSAAPSKSSIFAVQGCTDYLLAEQGYSKVLLVHLHAKKHDCKLYYCWLRLLTYFHSSVRLY